MVNPLQWLVYISRGRNRSGIEVTRERTHVCFPCSNNEVEYEALLVELKATKRLGIKKLKIFGDSKLVIKQVSH